MDAKRQSGLKEKLTSANVPNGPIKSNNRTQAIQEKLGLKEKLDTLRRLVNSRNTTTYKGCNPVSPSTKEVLLLSVVQRDIEVAEADCLSSI